MTGDSHNVRLSGEERWERWHQGHKFHYPKKFAEFNSALAKERWSDAQKAEIFRPYLAEKLERRYCTCLKISSSICSVNLPSWPCFARRPSSFSMLKHIGTVFNCCYIERCNTNPFVVVALAGEPEADVLLRDTSPNLCSFLLLDTGNQF